MLLYPVNHGVMSRHLSERPSTRTTAREDVDMRVIAQRGYSDVVLLTCAERRNEGGLGQWGARYCNPALSLVASAATFGYRHVEVLALAKSVHVQCCNSVAFHSIEHCRF